jgi:hypothetical protein
MKRLILLLIVSFVAFGTFAQEISKPSSSTYYTFGRDPVNSYNYSWFDVTGLSTDLLIYTTSDTIDIRFKVRKHRPFTIKTISKFDPITTADTTVSIAILGRNSENESYTSITSTTSSEVASDGTVASLSSATSPTYTATIAAYDMLTDTTGLSGYPADTISVPQQTITLTETSTLAEYNYITVRYIISGDDATGTGIEFKQLEIFIIEH